MKKRTRQVAKKIKTKQSIKPLNLDDLVEVLPETGTTVPAKREPTNVATYMMCTRHVDTQFRVGGFCEKCYSDETKDRIMRLDAKLDESVLEKLEILIAQILNSDDPNLIERFLGRVMKRFSRPETKRVEARLQAIHLHGPVDFGAPE